MRLRLRPATAVAAAATFTITGVGATIASQSASADEGTPAVTSPADIARARRANVSRHINRAAIHSVTSTTPTPESTPAVSTDQVVKFAPDNAWTLRADTATELASDSSAQVANLVRQVKDSVGNRAHINTIDHATTIVTAPPGTPRTTLGLNSWCAGKDSYMEYYRGQKVFMDVPIPTDMVAPTGVDKELTVYDPQSDQLWDFWGVEKTSTGWAACAGGRIDKVSQNRGMFQPTYGASASGLAIVGGSITLKDVERGSIDHALVLNVRETAGWQNPTWPAVFGDGKSGPASYGDLRQGQRLRLDPSVDVDSLGLNRMGTMIARAAQKYGFIVCDTSGTVNIPTESGRALLTTTGQNPWDTHLGGPEWEVLPSFPWDKLQALPLAYGK